MGKTSGLPKKPLGGGKEEGRVKLPTGAEWNFVVGGAVVKRAAPCRKIGSKVLAEHSEHITMLTVGLTDVIF